MLRIAWTIADLAGHRHPDLGGVTEAVQLGGWTIYWCTAPTGSDADRPVGSAR